MILLAIKSFFSGAWSIFAKHWRVILPLLILAYCLHKYNDAVSDKLEAQKVLAEHIKADKDAKTKRDADNLLKSILAQKNTDALVARHQDELSKLILKGKVEDETSKANDAISSRAISNYRDALRLAIEREAALRLSRDDANRSAGTDGHAAIFRSADEVEAELQVCKEAGAFAAADYNLCYGYVKSQQSIFGVQNE